MLEILRVTVKKPRLVVITGGEPFRQNLIPLIEELLHEDILVQIETAGTLWIEGLETFRYGWTQDCLMVVCSPKTGTVNKKIQERCANWKYLIAEGQISPEDGLPIVGTQDPNLPLRLYRPADCPPENIWLQPCEAYKVDKKVVIEGVAKFEGELSDQIVTSSVRDDEQTQRNIRLCAVLAMKYGYRVSLQMHKLLGLP
jgi:organic radical activating enzyme